VKKILICVILTAIVLSNTTVLAASPPPVVADGALLIDTNTGKILYEKNIHNRFYQASTTKIMTALLVLEHCSLNEKVIIGEKPSSFVDGSKIYLFKDEEFIVNQLLYALLIASANDAAIALAEHASGSEEAFVKLMNDRAKQLGCLDTNYANSHGLFDPNHYTTSYDLSLIAREAMKNETFREIVSIRSYAIPPTNKQPKSRPLNTNIQVMLNTKYRVKGASGIKVGYTTEAGHSYVGSASRINIDLMVVLLHDRKPGLWEDASLLLNYGFDNFSTKKELSKGDFVSSLAMQNSDLEIPLVAADDFYYTCRSGETPDIHSNIVINNNYKDSILKGQRLGYMEFTDNSGSLIGRVDLIADAELPSSMMFINRDTENNTIKKYLSPWVMPSAAGIAIIIILAAFGVIKKIKKAKCSR
jgi:D-alanyl-D-alanine carboxypeptidase